MTRKYNRYVRLALSCAIAAGAAPGVAAAAAENIIEVTTTQDSLNPADHVCSLREALRNANTNTAPDNASGECLAGSNSKTDVIVLKTKDAQNEFDLTLIGPGDEAGDLDIHDNPGLAADVDDLRIEVDGATSVAWISQRAAGERVLENHLARITVKDTLLRFGSADQGGGIYNAGGVIQLDYSDVIENSATSNGGGIYNDGGVVMIINGSDVRSNDAGLKGGGIYNVGDVIIRSGGMNHNTAGNYGGSIFNASGSMLLEDFSLQSSTALIGGAIANQANLTIRDSEIGYLNKAKVLGGAIANAGDATLVMENSSIGWIGSENYAGETEGLGGCIANVENASLTLVEVALTNCNAWQNGGGLYSDSKKPVTIVRSRIENNRASGGESNGGGIFLSTDSGATSSNVISQTLIAANDASWHGGGGLWIEGSGSVQIANSTISGNGYEGLMLDTGANVEVFNVTFSGEYSDGLAIVNLGQLRMQNSIIDAPDDGNACQDEPEFVPLVSLGYNMASDESCAGLDAVGDVTGIDPMLAPLGDNGGPTRTHALQGFSPAIDAGDAAACAAGPVGGIDQRGAVRPFALGCDIGAHEQGAPIPDVVFSDGFESS